MLFFSFSLFSFFLFSFFFFLFSFCFFVVEDLLSEILYHELTYFSQSSEIDGSNVMMVGRRKTEILAKQGSIEQQSAIQTIS